MTSPRQYRLLTLTVSTLLLIGTMASSASARPDPGGPVTPAASPVDHRCGLARIGSQFVRCDNLTGNGVHAPAWVPTTGGGR